VPTQKRDVSVSKRVPTVENFAYRLPETLVQEGLRLIERSAPLGDVMDLNSQQDTTTECWVLSVHGCGDFSQRQLMAMQFLANDQS
jgi:hypothetical protein